MTLLRWMLLSNGQKLAIRPSTSSRTKCCADVLGFPNFKKPFILATYASMTGLGACLSQEKDCVLKPVGFAGRGLTSAERNYTITEQECSAVVWAIQHFRVYLEGQEFELLTDHNALRYTLKQTNPRGRIARWITFLNLHMLSSMCLAAKM